MTLLILAKCRFSTSCKVEQSLKKYSEFKGSAKFLMRPSKTTPENESRGKVQIIPT